MTRFLDSRKNNIRATIALLGCPVNIPHISHIIYIVQADYCKDLSMLYYTIAKFLIVAIGILISESTFENITLYSKCAPVADGDWAGPRLTVRTVIE